MRIYIPWGIIAIFISFYIFREYNRVSKAKRNERREAINERRQELLNNVLKKNKQVEIETIFADFNGCAKVNRVRIYQNKNNNVEFVEGKEVWISDEDTLKVKGILTFSKEENMWHGEFDPKKFIHSD